MAESVSRKVRDIVDRTPFLRDVLRKGFLNYTNFAQDIMAEVSLACDKDVKESAIIMALRRYASELEKIDKLDTSSAIQYTIVMHTNIVYLDYAKTPELVQQIGNIYKLVAQGGVNDFLNVIVGSSTVTIAISEKLLVHLEKITQTSTLLFRADDMVALSMVWGSEQIQKPGIVYESARRLAWNSINVLGIFSTIAELSFVIKRVDSFEAYRVLQDLQGKT